MVLGGLQVDGVTKMVTAVAGLVDNGQAPLAILRALWNADGVGIKVVDDPLDRL